MSNLPSVTGKQQRVLPVFIYRLQFLEYVFMHLGMLYTVHCKLVTSRNSRENSTSEEKQSN